MKGEDMWKKYDVKLKMMGQFGASIPKTKEEIVAMLAHRAPTRPPEDATPLPELADQVAEEVGADEESLPGWATFKRNGAGLYYESRCVRGHLKDCAHQIAGMVGDIKNFRAKFVNRVYVETEVIPLGKAEPDGMEKRFIQVMTRQGPRSTFKFIDYLEKPELRFAVVILEDSVIERKHLEMALNYGAIHGLGAERSQGWGRYSWEVEEQAAK